MITGMPRIAIAMHDFDAAVETFRRDFGMPVVDLTPGQSVWQGPSYGERSRQP